MARGKGGSLLSARRSKQDASTSESSGEEDHDRAPKRRKARGETDDINKTLRSRERECEELREMLRKANEEKNRLNKDLRKALNEVADTEEDERSLVRTPPTSTKVKVPLDSPNLQLYPSAWIYEAFKATYKLNRMRSICKLLMRLPNFDAFRTLAALLMCDDDEPYFAQ